MKSDFKLGDVVTLKGGDARFEITQMFEDGYIVAKGDNRQIRKVVCS